MVRYVVLFVALAVPARALPVTYAFTATDSSLGSFTYDGTTGIGSLSYSAAPSGVLLNMSSSSPATATASELDLGGEFLGVWPAVHDAFPVYQGQASIRLRGASLFDGADLRTDLTVGALDEASLTLFVAWVDTYQNTCPVGTPLADCPRSAFLYAEDKLVTLQLVELHAVPEPALGALVTAAVLLAAATRRLGN